ncbi:MAG: hypothetical protein ABIB55_00140 [Candidatus Nealsonbacteria bacterium]
MNRALSKIWISIMFIVLFAGGVSVWQYWKVSKKEITGERVVKPKEVVFLPKEEEIYKPQARGAHKVAVIEFAPIDLETVDLLYCYDDAVGYYLQNNFAAKKHVSETPPCPNIIETYNLLDLINNPNRGIILNVRGVDRRIPSLFIINDWYVNEARKYDVHDFSIDLKTEGPFYLDEKPPRKGPHEPCNMLMSFFDEKAKGYQIDLSEYDFIAYVYFDDSWKLGEQEGFGAFWSCADFLNRRSYTQARTAMSLTPLGITDIIETVIHELTHNFGASDKYIGYHCTEDGMPPIENVACLMCGVCEDEDCSGGGIFDYMEEVIICPKTAEEIGWK